MTILKNDVLPVFRCKVFEEDLLYLFYGGVFYRRSTVPTNDATLLPVAFVFDPAVLSKTVRLYPFDTGAAHSGRYGEPWNSHFASFKDRYKVLAEDMEEIARKLVFQTYCTNTAYLDGKPHEELRSLADPCPTLFDFLSADLTDRGIDQRYRRIEAHCKLPLSLDHLIWIGYPKVFEEKILALKEHLRGGDRIICWSYRSFPAMPPNEAAAILQNEAQQAVIAKYEDDEESK